MASDVQPSRRRLGIALGLAALALVALVALGGSSALGGRGFDPKDGKYEGETTQQQKVSFKVVGKEVANPTYRVQSEACENTIKMFGSDKVNDKGKFKVTAAGVPGDVFKGQFVSKSKVEGKVTQTYTFGCQAPTKTVAYTAQRD